MQAGGPVKLPLGIVYNTTMSRPDCALALALIHGFAGKSELRIGAIAVCGAGLGAAAYCDLVNRFYFGGKLPNTNTLLPIGLAADEPMPADSEMVRLTLDRRNEQGALAYAREISKVSNTAEVPALIRNALTTQTNGNMVVVLSAPATNLARVLDLLGGPELIAAKVKTLIVCDTGAQDVAALRKVLAEWPSPIVLCGREVGDAVLFPGSSIDQDFGWTPAHPVADAYRAYHAMPYDAPTWDMAAVCCAAHPDSGLFQTSEPGTIEISADGRMKFTLSPGGKHRSIAANPARRDEIVRVYRELASAKPVPRQPRGPKKA